jgi:phospholipase C
MRNFQILERITLWGLRGILRAALVLPLLLGLLAAKPVRADGDLSKVKHIIVIMQENHSFDNYFGALAYAPGSPYRNGIGGCRKDDHDCVDGLACKVNQDGTLTCFNSNREEDGSVVFSFHDPKRCAAPDLNHSWFETHEEVNFFHPNNTLRDPDDNGFVRVNDATEQLDNGVESPTEDQTMGFYTQDDIPFYYGLAANFAVNDRYFASVLGPTFPNRSHLAAATSFGHLTASDTFPPVGGYKPITGTIFDLFHKNNVTWADYFQDAPQGGAFRPFSATAIDPHFLPLKLFLAQASGVPGVGPLPSVSFVDPNFGLFGIASENDEHPPTDIQRGQAYVSQVLSAVRNGPFWNDSVIFITYDEHGGYYDHVASPAAPQGHARTPDGIFPGQCADLSNVPLSLQPGGGAECSQNLLSTTDTTVIDAGKLCPEFTTNPAGPYPDDCASFDQLGVRVPFLAVSPFSKLHYVSHTIGDHTSILAFIEKRFLSFAASVDEDSDNDNDDMIATRLHLTKRDQHAHTLEDMFDFDRAPSSGTPITPVPPPAQDCTPK